MKRMYKLICTMLLCLLVSVTCSADDTTRGSDDVFQERDREYSLNLAARNLQKNKEFYLKMLHKVDGASGLAWKKILGENIISQPIAALEILSRSKVHIESVCPPFFSEETPDQAIDDWNQSAIEVLNAFQMTNKEDELTRQVCLKSILQLKEEMRKKTQSGPVKPK